VRFAAKQKPHRPGLAPALGLRAGRTGLPLVTQTGVKGDTRAGESGASPGALPPWLG